MSCFVTEFRLALYLLDSLLALAPVLIEPIRYDVPIYSESDGCHLLDRIGSWLCWSREERIGLILW